MLAGANEFLGRPHHIRQLLAILPPECALPDDQYAPIRLLQIVYRFNISLPVAADFLLPKLRTRPGPLEQRALVTVPEATVGKYHSMVFRENHVWLPRHTGPVQSESESAAMKTTSDEKLRGGVLALDPAHDQVALIRSQYVSRCAGGQDGGVGITLQGLSPTSGRHPGAMDRRWRGGRASPSDALGQMVG